MTRDRIRTRRANPALDAYLSDIRRDDLLTADEEAALARRIAAGDADARARMIRSNLRLVVKIARQYAGGPLSLDDLVGEGNVGLIRAVECYSPAYGTRFSTYAAHWIKQAIRQALTNTTATIRLPAHMVGLLRRWARTARALARSLGREPLFDEVADALGLSAAQREMVTQAMRARRLTHEGGGEPEAAWSSEEAPDERPSPELECEADEERDAVLRRLDRLDGRERMVVALRFGLEGQPPLTLKEIGRRLGITREWVRKIELRAVRKLDDAPADREPAPAAPRRALARTA
jgi:RNA polymerase primary sigma factor